MRSRDVSAGDRFVVVISIGLPWDGGCNNQKHFHSVIICAPGRHILLMNSSRRLDRAQKEKLGTLRELCFSMSALLVPRWVQSTGFALGYCRKLSGESSRGQWERLLSSRKGKSLREW
ncbi:hypothetical protein LSTR_LSTR005265 [Laodelphax striatellus]|uniref:Uncharacterized protein n=1 Tax=Laodelphax striatellus TaxID=195883 RepID=A0A482X7V2_LAOST|nr:hypothetical protein LSTR_LSTR005265 [Laodelphax striatellus]